MLKHTAIYGCALLAITVALEGATVTEYSRKTPAEYEHSNKRHGDYPFSFFTPRIEWARPFQLGKLKLLVVLPVAATREAVELGSRLDAEVKVINLKEHQQWFSWWQDAANQFYNAVPLEEVLHDAATRLLSPAYQYDAIVIGKVKWSVIPEDIRKFILDRARCGTALIFVTPWEVDEALQKEFSLGPPDNPLAQRIRESVPLGVLPLDADLEPVYPKPYFEPRRIGPMEIRTGRLGEGNVVFLDYQDNRLKDGSYFIRVHGSWYFYCLEIALTPFVEDDDLFYDYYFSILAKTILHAAGKETGIRIRPDGTESSVGQKQLPGSPLGFALSAGRKGLRDATVYYELRNRQNQVVKKGEAAVSADGETARFAPEMPFLPQGLYLLDAWAMRGGTVADWASAALRVTGTEYIEAIVPDKEFFRRDEPVGGTVKFKAPPQGVSVKVELWDTYQRLEQVVEPGAKDGKFQFKRIEHPLSRTYRMVGKVSAKGLVLEQKEVWVGLPSSEVDDFQFGVWAHAHNTRGNRTLMQLLYEQAITACYDPGWFLSRRFKFQSADALARHNLLAFPYTSGCWEFAGEGGPWNTEAYYRKINIPAAEAYRRYGAMAYSICEENEISKDEKAWNKPPALNDYRRFLKERYGDIVRLNEIWGTQFKSFDEIGLISFQDAKVGRQFTPWVEQQRHRVDRFSKAHELSSRIIRESDPEARTTFEACVPESYDWPRMAKAVQGWTRWCPLERWLDKDGVNLAAKKGNLASTGFVGWYPNTINEWYARTTPWQNLFLGYTHIIWWAGDLHAFTPDRCEPVLSLKQTAEECREIESGVGKLLAGSQKRLDPILILWSPSSCYAGVMSPIDVVWNTARESFETMLRHIGLDYQYIGEDFLENNLAYGNK